MSEMNTKFLEKEFDYIKPASLSEALDILSEREKVKIFAGGTDLMVKLKGGAPIEMNTMLDINAIGELFGTKCAESGIEIGAAEKISALEKNEAILSRYQGLYEAFHAMASVSVRNMATLGGNFCNASPVADASCAVLAYNGSVKLVKKGGERLVSAEDFFLAPGVSVLTPDELLYSIVIPAPKENTGAVYIKLSRVKSDIAKLSVCVVLSREGDKIRECRITMAAVAAKPLYLKEISQGLAGRSVSEALMLETAKRISEFIHPIDDNRTTAQYRKDVTKIIARDALYEAWKRSGGKL